MRYADDIVIFVRSKKAAERVLKSVSRFLQQRMKLQVNQTKSCADFPWNTRFLGFRITRMMGRTRLGIHPKALAHFKDKVRELTRRTRGISLHAVIRDLNGYLPGWLNYYGNGLSKKLKQQLNSWIVRRLRVYLWKQWRLPRTKVKNLKRLGIRHADAVLLGNTRKGAWRVSRYQTMHYALPAQWFRKHYGLVRLR